MSFSILNKQHGNKCPGRAICFTFLFAVSCLCVIGYAERRLCASEEPEVVSAPLLTLFPEVTGTPWLQQLNELEQGRQTWIRVSGKSPEPVSYIKDTEFNESNMIKQAGGELISSTESSLQQISGIIGVETSCECDICSCNQTRCSQTCCNHQKKRKTSASVRICSECRNTNCQHFVGEEQAPAQRLRPESWRSPIGIDPWIAVFQAENRANATFFGEKCVVKSDFDHRRLHGDLNSKLLTEDRPISQMSLNVQPKAGRMPQQRRLSTEPNSPVVETHFSETDRCWRDCLVHWNASEATHGPLYFEEANLERHGYSRGYWQPIFSGFQFFTTAPLLPGLMTVDRPFSLQYELGESRVGSCAPYCDRKIPWNTRAILVEIGVVTGISFIIP